MTEHQQENKSRIFDSLPPQRPNPMKRLRKVRETVMGFLYLLVAAAMIWATKTRYTELFTPTFAYGLAAVFILYGLFRLYRALIKKD